MVNRTKGAQRFRHNKTAETSFKSVKFWSTLMVGQLVKNILTRSTVNLLCFVYNNDVINTYNNGF